MEVSAKLLGDYLYKDQVNVCFKLFLFCCLLVASLIVKIRASLKICSFLSCCHEIERHFNMPLMSACSDAMFKKANFFSRDAVFA